MLVTLTTVGSGDNCFVSATDSGEKWGDLSVNHRLVRPNRRLVVKIELIPNASTDNVGKWKKSSALLVVLTALGREAEEGCRGFFPTSRPAVGRCIRRWTRPDRR